MYARTNKCYNERGSRTNYVRSSIPHCISFQSPNSATCPPAYTTRTVSSVRNAPPEPSPLYAIHHQNRLLCTQYKRMDNVERFCETNYRHYPLEVTVVTILTACFNFMQLHILLTQSSLIYLTILSNKTAIIFLNIMNWLVL